MTEDFTMIKIDQSAPFLASWNASIAHLSPDNGWGLSTLVGKVSDYVFYIPHSIVALCINPRRESQFSPSKKLCTNYGRFTKEIITPDQVHLVAHVRIVEGATFHTPTIIAFNPLGANDSVHFDLAARLVKKGCNVVTFDYRGLGSTRRAKDLVLDGESVYQYVTQELGTKINSVHFFGFSLGGAIAAQVKALHPESEGKYVGDRPFRSIFSLITENCCIERFGRLVKKITSIAFSIFLAYPVYLLGWEWDGRKALGQLRGDRRIVFHPNDCLVPFDASLASQCLPEEAIRLDPLETGLSTHFTSIEEHTTVDGICAADVVAEFLASEP
jgi:pimeloyl-ACP methyl ester carboxylesterase